MSNPARSRQSHPLFAALYDVLSCGEERGPLGRLRPELIGALRGRVLEIGAGTGLNFPHYAAGVSVTATEPDPHMLRRARRRAAQRGGTITVRRCAAEALPFADCSFDHVLATMVLCTVEDPARALAEIRRVLVIGGTFTFIEHVRGEGRLGTMQDLADPLWRRCVGGCRPNRRTEAAISGAGLEIVAIERDKLSFFMPLIAGTARRPSGDAPPDFDQP